MTAPLLVREDFGVGQAVQSSIAMCTHSQPAVWRLTPRGSLASVPLAAGGVSGEPAAGAALDPAQGLHVDMDQLTGPVALVADGRLKTEAAELAHPGPGQDP